MIMKRRNSAAKKARHKRCWLNTQKRKDKNRGPKDKKPLRDDR